MKRDNRRLMNSTGLYECEICDENHILEQHHIRGRNIRNADSPSNLANICANCHNKVHRGKIIIENRLNSTSGFILFWHYSNEDSFTGNDAKPYLINSI